MRLFHAINRLAELEPGQTLQFDPSALAADLGVPEFKDVRSLYQAVAKHSPVPFTVTWEGTENRVYVNALPAADNPEPISHFVVHRRKDGMIVVHVEAGGGLYVGDRVIDPSLLQDELVEKGKE